jgi:hypothetical protein
MEQLGQQAEAGQEVFVFPKQRSQENCRGDSATQLCVSTLFLLLAGLLLAPSLGPSWGWQPGPRQLMWSPAESKAPGSLGKLLGHRKRPALHLSSHWVIQRRDDEH